MKKYKLILLFLLITGFLIRFFNIDKNPVSMYWDETSIGYEAFSISETGLDMHGNSWFQAIFPAYGDYKAPVYIWLVSIVIKLIGPTVAAVRLPSVIFGSLSILTFYLLGNIIFSSKKTGLFTALMITIMPWSIQFSRAGFEANLALFFISLFLVLLIKGYKQKPTLISLSFLPAILAVYTYFSARIVIPLVFIWVSIFFAKKIKQNFKFIIASVSLFIICLIPLYQSPYFAAANVLRLSTDNITNNHQDIVYSNSLRQIDNNKWYSKLIHHRYLYLSKELLQNIFSHFDPGFLFFKGDPNPRHSTGFAGLILPILTPIFFYSIIVLLKKPKILIFIMGLWIIFLLPASVPRTVPHALRSLNGVIPLALILAFGLADFYTNTKKSNFWTSIKIVYAILILVNFLSFSYYLHSIYPNKSNLDWQDGYPQLASFIKNEYNHHDYLVVAPGDRLFLYALFYGQISPKDVQAIQIPKHSGGSTNYSMDEIDKITFRPIVWEDDQRGPTSSLLLGLPGDFPDGVKIKEYIKDTNDHIQFVAVDLSQQ